MLNKVMGVVGLVLGVCGLSAIGMDIYEHHKMAKKVGMSVDELEKASKDNIKEALVEVAIKSAAEHGVEAHLNRVKNEVFSEARIKLSEEVRKAVKEASETIQKEVGEKISTEASLIDISALKKSARDKAEAKILEKFDGNLEDLLAKFNENLSNIQKIYGGIADAISKGKEDKGLKFTIG